MDYYQKFQQLIDEYNSGAKNVDAFYTAQPPQIGDLGRLDAVWEGRGKNG